jgi:hypothetical protein
VPEPPPKPAGRFVIVEFKPLTAPATVGGRVPPDPPVMPVTVEVALSRRSVPVPVPPPEPELSEEAVFWTVV